MLGLEKKNRERKIYVIDGNVMDMDKFVSSRDCATRLKF